MEALRSRNPLHPQVGVRPAVGRNLGAGGLQVVAKIDEPVLAHGADLIHRWDVAHRADDLTIPRHRRLVESFQRVVLKLHMVGVSWFKEGAD